MNLSHLEHVVIALIIQGLFMGGLCFKAAIWGLVWGLFRNRFVSRS